MLRYILLVLKEKHFKFSIYNILVNVRQETGNVPLPEPRDGKNSKLVESPNLKQTDLL